MFTRQSLTISKYLEEFQGLVHFLYIDRNTHRITTPSLDMQAHKAEFIRQKIWSMIDFAYSHLKEGHSAIIWKGDTFTYGYFLWFEDSDGEHLKISAIQKIPDKCPGILGVDYYTKLKAMYFPKISAAKIRIYELFVMNLGIVSASALLQQAKKLSSTIWDLKGFPNNAIDLL
ncbi:hypothetical protein ABEB36_004681 [Hypothenemus hampei]|uniref:FUZ/MON1/HPS1 third Longin domain-containing protein n=1 Tax=Hypothenemus hampei TaxID=57062 RepID=A0ABD1F5P3_HYPHA